MFIKGVYIYEIGDSDILLLGIYARNKYGLWNWKYEEYISNNQRNHIIPAGFIPILDSEEIVFQFTGSALIAGHSNSLQFQFTNCNYTMSNRVSFISKNRYNISYRNDDEL